ncbi:MAG: hypothetical protein Q4E03_01965 [Trueperella sp.]|nr:hypothetical protein [Trueperella sp.]
MNTAQIARMLTRARLSTRMGEVTFDILAIVALSVSSGMLLTTLGGVWMFHERVPRVDAITDMEYFGWVYFSFALFALALLIVPLLSLGASASQLGANGRAQRLASLRLVGMTSRQVVGVSLLESLIQTLIGFTVGMGLYLLTLPAWQAVEFTGMRIETAEMLLPWWGVLAALGLQLVISTLATVFGLLKVSISPLGVARKTTPKALRWWRVLVLIGAVVLMWYLSKNWEPENSTYTLISTFAIIIFFVMSISIAGPFFLQTLARPLTKTRSVSRLVAARRIVAYPRAAWRSIAAISLMMLISSLLIFGDILRFDTDNTATAGADGEFVFTTSVFFQDVYYGVIIALSFALILGAVSVLIHQTSDVIDRTDESRALSWVGMPTKKFTISRIWQVFIPLIIMTAISVGLGVIPGLAQGSTPDVEAKMLLIGVIIAGFALTLLAVLFTAPIQRQVLAQHNRKND